MDNIKNEIHSTHKEMLKDLQKHNGKHWVSASSELHLQNNEAPIWIVWDKDTDFTQSHNTLKKIIHRFTNKHPEGPSPTVAYQIVQGDKPRLCLFLENTKKILSINTITYDDLDNEYTQKYPKH